MIKKISNEKFGPYIRRLRKEQKIGQRDFAKKIVNYFLKETSEGSKIDLKKTYVYHRPISPDYLVFDLGNTLISTFPIALQNPDFLSEIGYENTYDMAKISAIDEVVKLWKSYYKYN